MSTKTHRKPLETPETTDTAGAIAPAPSSGEKRPYLIIIAGSHVGELHKLSQERTVIGRSNKATIRIVDEGISREHMELVVQDDRVTIRDLGSTNGTFCNGLRVDEREVADGDKISLGSTTILKFSYQDGIDEAYQRDLYRSAVKDTATQALKKEFFLERLESEVAFAIRHNSPMGLVFWDLDKFKSINDRYGHPAGDRVLASTAEVVAGTIRKEDMFARYGGEEFALACRATPADRAFRMAERLRLAIEKLEIDVGGGVVLRVTASFGVAICPSDRISSAEELIGAADAAMYRAKSYGRNRTELQLEGVVSASRG